MLTNSFARRQIPGGAARHKDKIRGKHFATPTTTSSRTVIYKGLPLVQKLIQMGRKAEAVKLYRDLTGGN